MNNNILIIDDDDELSEEIAEILKDEGYKVTVAFNGLDGKSLIEKNKYNLLLLDLKIPGLTGFDILKIVKPKIKDLKVLVLTGRPLSKNHLKKKAPEEETLKLADGIMNKPFEIEILLQTIKGLIV